MMRDNTLSELFTVIIGKASLFLIHVAEEDASVKLAEVRISLVIQALRYMNMSA